MKINIHPTAVIHPTAIIGEGAQIGEKTEVGPYSVIGAKVVLGARNRVFSHVVLDGNTKIGDDNTIYQFASVGAQPQDLKFKGENSILEIGDKNIIREYATLQPGTAGGGMITKIGNQNLFMACSHVGHDSHVGDFNIFSNSATLAGHVEVGNKVILGGLAAVHQFVRLGDLSFLGGGSMVDRDIPPFCYAQGDRAKLAGLNKIGLERSGYSHEDRLKIFKIYKDFCEIKETSLVEKARAIREKYSNFAPADIFADFISASQRNIAVPRKENIND